MSQSTSTFSCYVVVRGEASHPDDEGLEGAYEVTVGTSAPVNLDKLSESEQHKIAAAVLDEFHEHQGIKVLDDFSIAVYLENGTEIDEQTDDDDEQFGVAAHYQGSVDQDQLPEVLQNGSKFEVDEESSGQPETEQHTPSNEGTLQSIIDALKTLVDGAPDIAKINRAYVSAIALRDGIRRHDARLDQAEAAPTGDDYNEILERLGLA